MGHNGKMPFENPQEYLDFVEANYGKGQKGEQADIDTAEGSTFSEEIDSIIDLALAGMSEKYLKNKKRDNILRPSYVDLWNMVNETMP